MTNLGPLYQIGDALFFRYVPFDMVDPETGEALTQTPEIPCTVLSIAHSYRHDIETAPGVYLARTWNNEPPPTVFYFVRVDQEEAATLGLTLTHLNGSPLTTEVIRENQITRERIEF